MKIKKHDATTYDVIGYNPNTRKEQWLGSIKKVGDHWRVSHLRSISYRSYPPLAAAKEAVKKW